MVGNEISKILSLVGLSPVSSCSCKDWRAKMNSWGVDGCKKRRREIIDHLTQEYHSTNWLQCAKAAALAVKHGIPLSIEGIVDLAIERARSSSA